MSLNHSPVCTRFHLLSSRRFLATNKTEMMHEHKLNEAAYWKIRDVLPKGKTVGFVDGTLIAFGDSFNRVSDETLQEVIHRNGGDFPKFNSSFVTIVGQEYEEPQVIVIESPEGLEVPATAFHSTTTLRLSWTEVAKPVDDEWIPSSKKEVAPWVLRFVGPYARPYVTLPVSTSKNSHPMRVTFFIDTGSAVNFLKSSVFTCFPGLSLGQSGNTNLWINGESYSFSPSKPDSVHGNINLLGTGFLEKNYLLFNMLQNAYSNNQHEKHPKKDGKHPSLWEEGRNEPPGPGDWK